MHHAGPVEWVYHERLNLEVTMAKYGPKAQDEVEKTMHEYKEGELKSSSGDKVKNPKQAVAIGLSKARQKGAKVPEKK
jgi:hypothetical protein